VTVNGIPLRDFPALLKVRLTVCRQQGHFFYRDEQYCKHCGAYWLFHLSRRGRGAHTDT
jgi:hypothetical protein